MPAAGIISCKMGGEVTLIQKVGIGNKKPSWHRHCGCNLQLNFCAHLSAGSIIWDKKSPSPQGLSRTGYIWNSPALHSAAAGFLQVITIFCSRKITLPPACMIAICSSRTCCFLNVFGLLWASHPHSVIFDSSKSYKNLPFWFKGIAWF